MDIGLVKPETVKATGVFEAIAVDVTIFDTVRICPEKAHDSPEFKLVFDAHEIDPVK